MWRSVQDRQSHHLILLFLGSINLDEDNDEMISYETSERPIGKKTENEKLKKRKTSDDVVPIFFLPIGWNQGIKEENALWEKRMYVHCIGRT